ADQETQEKGKVMNNRAMVNFWCRIAVIPVACLFLVTALAERAYSAQDLGDLGPAAADVLTKEQRDEARAMIDRDIQRRTAAFNERHRAEWYKIKTRDQWDKYRDERIGRLRASLGDFPRPGKPNVRVTSVVKGDGYQIENLLYESRPGQ